MSRTDQEQRSIDERIARLRNRLKEPNLTAAALRSIMLGILDLLGSEL